MDPSTDAFSGALQGMAAGQLKSDAFKDVRNVGLTALGAGAAGRGLVGLIQMMRENKPKKTRSGPAYLPLPFPAQPEKVGNEVSPGMLGRLGLGGAPLAALAGILGGDKDRSIAERGSRAVTRTSGALLGGLGGGGIGAALGGMVGKKPGAIVGGSLGGLLGLGRGDAWAGKPVADFITTDKSRLLPKQAGFLDGDNATTKGGIPWYGPAMLMGGLGGLGLGWKGMDKVINSRRKKQMDGDLETARSQFHDALLSQYAKPVEMHPELIGEKKSSDDTMVKVGQALDDLFVKFTAAMADEEARPSEKRSFDMSNLAGQAAGGYGMYAGLSGLLTGAMVYDKMNKRSRRSVLDSALKKRQRRKFMQQPTEIYAQPEPVPAEPPVE